MNGTSVKQEPPIHDTYTKPCIKEENGSEASTSPPLNVEYEQELPLRPPSVTMSSFRSSPAPSTSSNGGYYDTVSPYSGVVPGAGMTTNACSNCSATFPNREQLEKHELIHSLTGTVVSKALQLSLI